MMFRLAISYNMIRILNNEERVNKFLKKAKAGYYWLNFQIKWIKRNKALFLKVLLFSHYFNDRTEFMYVMLSFMHSINLNLWKRDFPSVYKLYLLTTNCATYKCIRLEIILILRSSFHASSALKQPIVYPLKILNRHSNSRNIVFLISNL